MRLFLEDLKQIGPYSKQILNYSYPPLLYQRGDDDEEGGDDQELDDVLGRDDLDIDGDNGKELPDLYNEFDDD